MKGKEMHVFREGLLSIGIPEIDNEHIAIFKLSRALRAKVDSHKPENEIIESFREMISAVQIHFDNEEKLLVPYSLPKMKEHIAEHKRLLETLTSLEINIRKNEENWRQDIVNLTDTLTEHIRNFDFHAKSAKQNTTSTTSPRLSEPV